jgi:hypothetical protein
MLFIKKISKSKRLKESQVAVFLIFLDPKKTEAIKVQKTRILNYNDSPELYDLFD